MTLISLLELKRTKPQSIVGGSRKADAIVVLGCRGSSVLVRRLELGIRLFEAGTAPLLVLSGGGKRDVPEAEWMRRAALAHGLPQSALVVEPDSRNTFENARETARLLSARGLRSVLLVSDRAHLLRAVVLFRLAGLRVTGRAGVPARSLAGEAAASLRELLALPWSLLRATFPHAWRDRSSRRHALDVSLNKGGG